MLKDEGIFYLSPEEKKKLKEQKKIDVNIRNGNYATLLHEACYQGRIAVVRELIAKNADINAENCYGAIPLGYAILKNHYDIAELLLENGADPNGHVSTDSGWSRSVLVQAIAFDENPKMAALLKKYGANLNHRGKYGQTDAHSSYYYCDHLKKLLKAGLNLNVKDNFGKNAFFYLPSGFQIENEEIDGIVKLLKKSGLDINRHEEITKNTGEYVDFINPLIQAVIDGDYARTEILLRNGARIEAGAWAMQSVTPLHIAAMAGDYEMVKLLVERGASIEGWHYWRVTPLSSAADLGKDYPRDVLRVDHSSEEYAKIVELLIEKGANVNNVEKYENTPLHHAVEGGCEKIVRILLKHGAKIDAANCDKETPLDVAKKLGKLKIQKIMEEAQKGMGK
ncbi:MAG: ankyrin repeat domain-containing protein [Holosporaceae bacterium]|nr:ankyrin repeat domain-containing protein [Holosporaceae bacterium]